MSAHIVAAESFSERYGNEITAVAEPRSSRSCSPCVVDRDAQGPRAQVVAAGRGRRAQPGRRHAPALPAPRRRRDRSSSSGSRSRSRSSPTLDRLASTILASSAIAAAVIGFAARQVARQRDRRARDRDHPAAAHRRPRDLRGRDRHGRGRAADLHVAAHGQRRAADHPQRAPRRRRPAQRLDPLADGRARGDRLARARRPTRRRRSTPSRRSRTSRRAHRRRHRDRHRGARRRARRSRRRTASPARRTLRAGALRALREAGVRARREPGRPGTGVPRATANPSLPWGPSRHVPTRATAPERRNQAARSGSIFLILGLLVVAGLDRRPGSVVGWVISVANSAPDARHLKPIDLGATSRVYAADGTRLGLHPGQRAAHAGLLEARSRRTSRTRPSRSRTALLRAQGRRLRGHRPRGVKNLENRHDVQGGSTLTMQLVRNLYTGDRSSARFKRKIREAKLAEDLENLHPGREGKQWILTKYLNNVPYGTVGGQTAVGIQAAARIFFDKPASEAQAPRGRAARRPAAGAVAVQPVPAARAPRRRAATTCCSGWPTRATSSSARPTRTKRMGLGVKRNRYYTDRREGYFFDYVKQELIDKYGARHRPPRRPADRHDDRPRASRARRARRWTATSAPPDRSAAIVDDRPAQRLHPGDGVVVALRRLEVQPRRPGPPPGRARRSRSWC